MDFKAILPEIISVGVVLLFGTVISIGVILHLRKLYYTIKSDIYEALRNEAMVHQGDEKHETDGDDRINQRDDVENTNLAKEQQK